MNGFQKLIVNDAIDDPSKLTDWEYDFVNDLVDREETALTNLEPDGYKLSDKQNAIVNRISQKYQ